jgi:CRP/FNR family cyclic AMP-dependent transcriptional regulator
METLSSVLIADDDADVREAIAAAIKGVYKEVRIYMADDGSEAMQKLRNAPPSLVIIDIDMPKVSGIEMIEQMQKINTFSRIPIIVISGLDHNSDEIQTIRSKGMMFAEKPFKTQFLIGLIEDALTGNKSRPVQLEPKVFMKGEIIFQEGDPSGSIFLVKTGKLRVYKIKDGVEKNIATIGQNELVGEMAFVDKKPRSANVMAEEDCALIELPIADVNSYLSTQPIWLRTIFNTLLARLRQTSANLE